MSCFQKSKNDCEDKGTYSTPATDTHMSGTHNTRCAISYYILQHHREEQIFWFAVKLAWCVCWDNKQYNYTFKPTCGNLHSFFSQTFHNLPNLETMIARK